MGEFTEKDLPIEIPSPETIAVGAVQHFKEFSSGAGTTIFKANKDGVFAGNDNFTDAPWSIDYNGVQYVGANGEITIDGPNKKIIVGSGNEIVIDAVTKKITVGTSSDVVLDGSTGTVTTDKIIDKTYGLYGVFTKTAKVASGGGDTTVTLVPNSGGLLNVTLNYTTNSDARYKLLPGFNTSTLTSYYRVEKSGGNYVVQLYRSSIEAEVSGINYYYISAFFNSQESNGW